ncbi:MAG: PAS domain-containing protein [Bacteroidales bacterium]|nr:PAS domain-containing protein [Bacteroidales bacterium]
MRKIDLILKILIILTLINTDKISAQHYYIFGELRNNEEKNLTIELLQDTLSFKEAKTFKMNSIEQIIESEPNYQKAVGSLSRIYEIYLKINDTISQNRILKKINNYKIEHPDKNIDIQILILKSLYNRNQKDYKTANSILEKAINIAKEDNNKIALARIYNIISEYQGEIKNTYLSTINILKSIQYAEESRKLKIIADIYFDASMFFIKSKDYQTALAYITVSEDIYYKYDDFENLGKSLIIKGYVDLAQHRETNAISNFMNAIELLKPYKNKNWTARAYNSLGYLYEKRKDNELAKINLIESLNIRKKIGDKKEIAESLISYGEFLINTNGNIDSAILFLKQSYDIAVENNEKQYIIRVAQDLSFAYELINNYKQAYKYSQISNNNKLIINSTENIEQIKAIYEHKNEIIDQTKKQDEKKSNETIKTQNNLILYLSIIGVVALIAIFIISFSNILKSQKNKKLEEQKSIIQKKSLELQTKNIELERISFVADQTDNGIIIINSMFVIEWLNKGILKLLWPEYLEKADKFIHKPIKQLFSDDVILNLEKCFSIKESVSFELKWPQNKWFQTTLTPFKSKIGNKKIIAIITDISQQKYAEEEIEKNKRELEMQTNLMSIINSELNAQKTAISEQNEELKQKREELMIQAEELEKTNQELEKLSLVAKKTDNTIFIADSNGKITWGNQAFVRLTGFNIEEYISKYDYNPFIINNSENNENTNNNIDAVEIVKQTKKAINYISTLINIKGKITILQTDLSPVLDENNNVAQLIAVMSDITKLKQAKEKIDEQNKEITESLEYARKIQDALQPMPIYMNTVLDEYFIINIPKNIVSGDFHWIDYKNGNTIIALADCTGHGIPGAFMSMLGTVTLSNIISSLTDMSASSVLNQLREKIIKLLHQRGKFGEAQDGMDISLCIYNEKKKTLHFSGAFSFTYIARKGKPDNDTINIAKKTDSKIITSDTIDSYLFTLKPDRMPIGIHCKENTPFHDIELKVNKGDILYMTSDGYIDQFGGEKNKKFYSANFEKMLLNIQNLDINQQKEKITKRFYEWKGENDQVDDVHIIGIKL